MSLGATWALAAARRAREARYSKKGGRPSSTGALTMWIANCAACSAAALSAVCEVVGLGFFPVGAGTASESIPTLVTGREV